MATMRMRGGNTDELYKEDRRLRMAESLAGQHPDLARVGRRWNRPQHYVDYSCFKLPDYAGYERNKLIRRPGVAIRPGVDNYGMVLID